MLDVVIAVADIIFFAFAALFISRVVIYALSRLMWAMRKGVALKTSQTVEPNPFHAGDMVMLKPDLNPYKGTLRCGCPYLVLTALPFDVIKLRSDNGTEGTFWVSYFEKYDGIGRTMPIDLSGEYDEAIRAQEIMEDVSNR